MEGQGGAAVQVVGGGVAGCELAWALAAAGRPTRLITTSLDTLYTLPAERWQARPPAGSLWARLAEEAMDRGSAQAEPGQSWQNGYALRRAVKRELERLPQLQLLQSNVTALVLDEAGRRVAGVRTWEGPPRPAPLTVLAVGSFMGARLRLGRAEERAGRLSEMAYDELRDALSASGLAFQRRRLSLPGSDGAPGYQVGFDAFAGSEMAPWADGVEVPGSGRLARWSGVGAVGVCVAELDLEATARAGMELGRWLAEAEFGH